MVYHIKREDLATMQKDWDIQTARALAIASDMAYGKVPAVINEDLKYLDPTMHSIETVEVGTSEATFFIGNYCTVISFRGTDELKDWMHNLDVVKVPTPEGSLMRGFEKEVDKIYQACRAKVMQAPRFFVTGHSKGAATGVNFLDRLRRDPRARIERKLVAAYFFGCPRSMDSQLAKVFDRVYGSRTFRVINNNDIVCRIPSFLRWRHVSVLQETYIDSYGRLHRGGMPLGQMLADRVRGRWAALQKGVKFDGVYDHTPMSKYIINLQSVTRRS